MQSNISQILLLYKTWGYYNKFDSTQSMGAYYWYVKIPQCGYMEHRLRYLVLCSKTHGTLHSLLWLPTGSWWAARGARICETCLLEWCWVVRLHTGHGQVWPPFNEKMSLTLTSIGNLIVESHCGDKMIFQPSDLHNGISCTGKMAS